MISSFFISITQADIKRDANTTKQPAPYSRRADPTDSI